MTNFNKQSSRLPHQFKFVGLGVIVLTILFVVAVKVLPLEIASEHKELFKNAVLSSLLLGLAFVAFAREKTEDERTVSLKRKALAGGFAGAIGYAICKPFINLLMNNPMDVSGQEVALVMLFSNILIFYLQKFTGKE